MDPVSVVLIAVVGLGLAWLVHKAFSNSRHSPPTKLQGGQHDGLGAGLGNFGFDQDVDHRAPGGSMAHGRKPRSPRSGRGDDGTT